MSPSASRASTASKHASIRASEKNLIRDAVLFDVYQGKGIPEGKKSLAVSVTLQSDEKTLTEEDLNGISQKIVDLAAKHYAAQLRA